MKNYILSAVLSITALGAGILGCERGMEGDAAVTLSYIALKKDGVEPKPEPKPETPQSIVLPDDKDYVLILVFNENRRNDPQQVDIWNWVNTNDTLKELRDKCRKYYFYPGIRGYENYVRTLSNKTPQVWLVRSDKQTIYSRAGSDLPDSADKLVEELKTAIVKFKERHKINTQVQPTKSTQTTQKISQGKVYRPTLQYRYVPAYNIQSC